MLIVFDILREPALHPNQDRQALSIVGALVIGQRRWSEPGGRAKIIMVANHRHHKPAGSQAERIVIFHRLSCYCSRRCSASSADYGAVVF